MNNTRQENDLLPRDQIPSREAILNWTGPESDYMNREHRSFFFYYLTDMKADLQKNAASISAPVKEQEITADPADRATLEEEYALELRARDRERKLLEKINQALFRIAERDYGYCEETGEPIGLARLLARPTATMTVEAQEKYEKMKRQFAE